MPAHTTYLKKSRCQVVYLFYLPAFKTGITLAIIGAVVGEFVGANGGLGYLTIYAAGLMNTPLVFAAILQLTIMGIILYSFMSWLEKKIIPWYNNENNGF